MGSILLVEDNDSDAFLVEHALTQFAPDVEVVHVQDGYSALQHLMKCIQSKDRPLPNCVLLDMIMVPRNGVWLLNQMKQHRDLRDIPVLVLSADGGQVSEAKEFSNVVGAMEKPDGLDARRDLARFASMLAGNMSVNSAVDR
jgi:CheY-like chemotaxis protein